jgi:hypothetical protein
MSPIMQYTRDPKGLVFAYTWNVFAYLRAPFSTAARRSSLARAYIRCGRRCSDCFMEYKQSACKRLRRFQ